MRFLVTNLPRVFLAMTSIVLIGAFQNCSNDMRFDAEGSLVAKGGDEGPNTGDGGSPVSDPSNRDPGYSNPIVKNPGRQNPGGGGGGCGSGKRPVSNSAANIKGSDFLCVLGTERGVDVTVNYVFDAGASGASVPVCMSERACTQIAGGVFEVKAAKRSLDCSTQADAAGYVKFSDGQVKEAVEKTKFYRQLKNQANMRF